MLLHSLVHLIYSLLHALGFCQIIFLCKTGYFALLAFYSFLGKLLAQSHIILAGNDEQTGYHQTLCLASFALVFGGLVFLTLRIKIPVADAPVVIGSVNFGWLAMPQIFSYVFLLRFSAHNSR